VLNWEIKEDEADWERKRQLPGDAGSTEEYWWLG
jgi:hypothetical protein